MQSVEQYFNDIIAKYNLFKHAAVKLIEDVPLLRADEIFRRCEELTSMYQDLVEKKEQLFIYMEFFGPGILDTAYIGDFQRALDKTIGTCEKLYQVILLYRDTLSKTSTPPLQ